MALSLKGRSFLTLNDYTAGEIRLLLDTAREYKRLKYAGVPHRIHEGKNVALLFEKTSTRTRCAFTVAANATFKGQSNYQIEGDWSNTAIWMVAAGMTGKPITITGMNKNSVQADRRIMQVMIDAGCDVVWDGMNVTVTGRAVKPIHADLEQMPDMLPVMAALACSIQGESSFVKGARLRLKESDRLEAVANLVRDLGGTIREEGDDLYIIGSGILKGGQGDCVNDHRLVMAGTLMALISENPVTLKDSEAITKSYPDFFEDWNLLGGNANGI